MYDPSQNDTTESICGKQRFSIVIKAAICVCKHAFVANPEALQPSPLQSYASIERMPEITSEVAKLDEEICAFIKSIVIRTESEGTGNLLQCFQSIYKLKELAKIREQISGSFQKAMQTIATKFCDTLGRMISSYQYQSAKAQYGKLYDTLSAQ